MMTNASPFGRRKKSTGQMDFKVVITGIRGVGKTAITVRYLTKRFIGEYGQETDAICNYYLRLIGAGMVFIQILQHKECRYHHQAKIDNDLVSLEILDIGPENSVTEELIAWADAFLLVYSITDPQSMRALHELRPKLDEARSMKTTPLAFMVLGNKSDLMHARKVSTKEGEKFAKDLGCSYLEISAADSYQQIVDLLHDLYREAKMYKFGTKSSLLGRVFGHAREKKTMTL